MINLGVGLLMDIFKYHNVVSILKSIIIRSPRGNVFVLQCIDQRIPRSNEITFSSTLQEFRVIETRLCYYVLYN